MTTVKYKISEGSIPALSEAGFLKNEKRTFGEID